MNNWKQQKLGIVADVKLSNVDKLTIENERVVRLCNYTDVYKNSFINNEKSKSFMLASCNENEYEKFILKKGQVAITKDSETPNDIGVSTYISEDFEDVVLGYHLALITPDNDKLNGQFLHYWLNTKQAKRYFENNAGGSGQRCTLVLDCIKSTPLYLPKLSTQAKIAKVLSDLDTKIELNNRINRELEAMAKTLYDYWFVQFDFPNEQGKPYKASGGKMVYNAELKREIPDGWEVKKLGELVYQVTDSISPDEYPGLQYLPIDKLPMKQLYYCEYESRSEANSSLIRFKENDILLGAMRVYFHRVCHAISDGISRSTIIVLRPFKENTKNFALFALNKNEAIEFATNNSTGTSIPYAKWNDSLENYLIGVPKTDCILILFNKIVNPILEKFKVQNKQTQQLSELRDWLLPMLMNGQITVKEAEERLSMAAEPSVEYKKG